MAVIPLSGLQLSLCVGLEHRLGSGTRTGRGAHAWLEPRAPQPLTDRSGPAWTAGRRRCRNAMQVQKTGLAYSLGSQASGTAKYYFTAFTKRGRFNRSSPGSSCRTPSGPHRARACRIWTENDLELTWVTRGPSIIVCAQAQPPAPVIHGDRGHSWQPTPMRRACAFLVLSAAVLAAPTLASRVLLLSNSSSTAYLAGLSTSVYRLRALAVE